jgi:hypothetical protein
VPRRKSGGEEGRLGRVEFWNRLPGMGEGWEAKHLLVLAVLNGRMCCKLKSGVLLVAWISSSLVMEEEGAGRGEV